MSEPKDITEGHGRPVHLCVLVPSGDYWLADFALSLMTMQQLWVHHPLSRDFKHNLINERGSLVDYQREMLAEQGLDSGATHFLWLDSDMRFPANLAHLLFKHDLPCVACNYVKRRLPAMPNTKSVENRLIATNRDSHGLVEAASTGFGAVMIKREVLEAMEQPYFDTAWIPRRDGKPGLEKVGEDVFFFHKMRKFTPYKLYVDHDASQKVAHIGTFDYENALAEATWDELEMDDLKSSVMT